MSLFSRLKKKKKASMDGPAVESPPPDSSPTPPAPERYEPVNGLFQDSEYLMRIRMHVEHYTATQGLFVCLH